MILVDAATGSIELLEPLQRAGYPAEKANLEYGDFAWQGRGEGEAHLHIGVERKTIGDLIGSLRSGRLCGHQLGGMQRSYDVNWLLVEGEYRVDKQNYITTPSRGGWRRAHGNMTLDELNKELSTLCLRGGLYLWHTIDTRHSVRWIGAHYRWWTDRALDQHSSHLIIYHPQPLVPVSQFRQTVATLPGVGYKTSLWAEQQFKTLRRAFMANAMDWQDVKGVGTVTAKRIVEAINK